MVLTLFGAFYYYLFLSFGLCAQKLKPTTWEYSADWLAQLWVSDTPVLLRGGPRLLSTSLDNFLDAFEEKQFGPTVGELDEEGRFTARYKTAGSPLTFRGTLASYAETPSHPESAPKTQFFTMSKLSRAAKLCGRNASKRKPGQTDSSIIPMKCYYAGHILDMRGEGHLDDERRFINLEAVSPGGDFQLLESPTVQFFLSSARNTIVHPHMDVSPNLFHHITGPKTFYILPPAHSYTPMHSSLSTLVRQLAVKTIADHEFVTKVMLNPGDFLFVPPYWAHEVHAVSTVPAMTASIALWSRPRLWKSYPKLKKPLWTVINDGTDMVTEALALTGLDYLDDNWLPEKRTKEVVAILSSLATYFDFPDFQYTVALRIFIGWGNVQSEDPPGRFGCLVEQSHTWLGDAAARQLREASIRMPRVELLQYAEALLQWATALGDVVDFSNLCSIQIEKGSSCSPSAETDDEVCSNQSLSSKA